MNDIPPTEYGKDDKTAALVLYTYTVRKVQWALIRNIEKMDDNIADLSKLVAEMAT